MYAVMHVGYKLGILFSSSKTPATFIAQLGIYHRIMIRCSLSGFHLLGGGTGRKLPPPKEASFPPKEITTKVKS